MQYLFKNFNLQMSNGMLKQTLSKGATIRLSLIAHGIQLLFIIKHHKTSLSHYLDAVPGLKKLMSGGGGLGHLFFSRLKMFG